MPRPRDTRHRRRVTTDRRSLFFFFFLYIIYIFSLTSPSSPRTDVAVARDDRRPLAIVHRPWVRRRLAWAPPAYEPDDPETNVVGRARATFFRVARRAATRSEKAQTVGGGDNAPIPSRSRVFAPCPVRLGGRIFSFYALSFSPARIEITRLR